MSRMRISLLGKFCVRCGDAILNALETQKAQELLCYLLLYRDRPHPREKLASLLWENSPQAKKYLRQALWQLQSSLDGGDDLLLVEADWIQVNEVADLWLDCAQLEEAFMRVQGRRGNALTAADVDVLHEAVSHYRGDLLEGWYQDWCIFERERLQNVYLVLLDKLMGYCESHDAYERGIQYGTRILRCDRARERTHRRLMRLHALAGDRTGALRQYQRCVTALREELDVAPAGRTLTLYEQIQNDKLDATLPLDPATATLPALLAHLTHLRTTLADVQRQLERDIDAVRRSLTPRR